MLYCLELFWGCGSASLLLSKLRISKLLSRNLCAGAAAALVGFCWEEEHSTSPPSSLQMVFSSAMQRTAVLSWKAACFSSPLRW